MDEKKLNQIEGRLAAQELILAQTLTLALLRVDDKKGLISDMRDELTKRSSRLNKEAYEVSLDFFDRISESAAATAQMLLDEARKRS